MKYSNTSNTAHPRKQQATVSSTVVRCVCVTASCVVTACGLLGLGATCFAIRLTDPSAAPCPFSVTVTVFAAAGLLLLASSALLLLLCRRRNGMRRKALLEDIPAARVEEECGPAEEEAERKKEEEEVKEAEIRSDENQGSGDNLDMIQKSADVSLWIEQQKPNDADEDCFPLETTDGATSQDTDGENSEAEITPL